ncbi:BRCA2 and CDKN1A-interacting protein isoform X2 [Eptesicus fuscus]|uniref:BRCA2 and CDKN1A-interacting protein isoform X2 n=1 Tax=Eptesicus fuscus TaxID=29078 RepID=UPI002403F343|nr:BRCA2 and CDKN1A-interacting protein isoform X2 [Eptesicus fuscus]
MASRPKRRAVGGGTPQTPGAPVPCHEEEENEEMEDQGDDDDEDSDEDSDEEEDEDDEAVGELFLKAPVNTAELTELLIQQNHIGSVIKQTDVSDDSDDDVDEDEVFGFISLLNLTERKGTQCAEQIKALTLSRCAENCEKSVVEQLDQLFKDSSRPVGLLLSERLINVPAQVALPMHRQLQKELAEAQRTNKPCGKCHFYLLISKTFAEAGKGNSKKKKSSQKEDELMFANAEEEFFYEPCPEVNLRGGASPGTAAAPYSSGDSQSRLAALRILSGRRRGTEALRPCPGLSSREGSAEVQLLRPGGERLASGRQVVLRRRPDEAPAHRDAGPV